MMKGSHFSLHSVKDVLLCCCVQKNLLLAVLLFRNCGIDVGLTRKSLGKHEPLEAYRINVLGLQCQT